MRRRWMVGVAAAVAAAPALALAGCGDDAGASGSSGSITVFAAASLTDAFDEIGAAFEADHPEVDVRFSYAGSSALREQILAGAPADVFAAADPSTMAAVSAASTTFARNELRIAVPAGNPGHVTGLEDFADPDLLLGLCAEGVPCGDLGRQALADAGVTPSIDTDEPDVRALLTKVASGDLDAGIVYATDVRSAGEAVEGIDIPADQNVIAEYPIASLGDAGRTGRPTGRTDGTDGAGGAGGAGEAFVAFVLSDEGQAILAANGFVTG